MLTADECRRRAEEEKRFAAETKDYVERKAFERIAREWSDLAEHKARHQES